MKEELKNQLSKFIAIFCISLIVITLFYMMDVSAQAPEINVELPRYYNENEIDISGTTVPYATVRLYVNDMVVVRRALGSQQTGENGIINFQRVALAAENNIKIWVQDQTGATNEANYQITVDTENPRIDLEELPKIIGEKNLTVKGTVNENVTINFYLDYGEIDNVKPAKITGLVADNVDKNSIEFSWDESQDSDFAKYIIYREDVGVIAITKPAHYNSYNDILVNSGVNYTYRVSAVDRAGNEGPKSDPLTVTTLDGGATDRRSPDAIDLEAERRVEQSIQTNNKFEVFLEPREEGNYILTIEVIDLAKNKVEIKHEFILDTTPPEFFNIIPRSGSLIYENFADRVDIEGYTDPIINVSLFINKSQFEREEYLEKTNFEGYFKFINVDLTRFFSGFGVHEVSPSELGDYYAGEFPITASTADVYLEAIDALGRKATEKVRYRIGTCWSGNLTWDVRMFPEFQSPTWLSTERIAGGDEWIYFMFNLSYARQGSGKVTSLSVSKACDDYVRNDPRYNWSCRIMPSTCRTESSPDKTAWFVSCPLGSMDEMNRWTEDNWKSFFKDLGSEVKKLAPGVSALGIEEQKGGGISAEMIFPFRLRIRYTYDIDGNKGSEHQTTCFPVTYVVDNTKINFMDVLPDWLMYDTADWLNSSITKLNEAQDFLEELIQKIGTFCLGSYAIKSLAKIYRKYTCYMEAFSYSVQGATLPATKTLEANGFRNLISQNERNKLSNLELKNNLPKCSAAWDYESVIYTAYRGLCDRIFCHGAPAGWTKGAEDKQLETSIEDERRCDTDSSTMGQPLRKEKCKDLWDIYNRHMMQTKREYVPVGKECFQVWNLQTDGQILRYLYTFAEKQDLSSKGVYELTLYENRPSKKILYAIKQSENFYLTKRAETCEQVCNENGYNVATPFCKKVSDCESAGNTIAKSFGFTDDCYYQSGDVNVIIGDNSQREECCCVKESKTEPSRYYTATDRAPSSTESKPVFAFSKEINEIETISDKTYPKFSYRYYSTKFQTIEEHNQYNPYRYIAGRDFTACFGMNNLLDAIINPLTGRKTVYLDPFKAHWPALQCACLSGVYNRITALKNMMAAMNNCLVQVRTTGTADAGVCKEVFSQYVCSLFWRLITFTQDGCYPWQVIDPDANEKQEINIGTYAKAGTTALWETISESATDLQQDYGNVQLTNILGYGQEETARRICMAAFGYDWSIEGQDLLDIAYSVPYATLVQPVTSTREYLTFDPTRGKGASKYEYRASWILNPGCDLDNYDIYLTCVTRDEMNKYKGINCRKQNDPEGINCDCLNSNIGASELFFDGRGLSQGELEDRNKNDVITSQHRYDHLKFVLKPSRLINVQQLKEDCFPEGYYDYDRDEAIFYFPIRDKTARDIAACSVDIMSGEFTCPSSRFFWGTEMNGQLVLEQTKINGQIARDGILLFAGEDALTVQPTVWKAQEASDMCLYINVYRGNDYEERGATVRAVSVPGTYQFPEITLLEPGNLKIRGIRAIFPQYITGRLLPGTSIIDDKIEFNIGFKDGDGDRKIVIDPNSKDLVDLGDGYKLFSNYRNRFNDDNDFIVEKRYDNQNVVKFEITNVQLPPPQLVGGERIEYDEVKGKIIISSESQARTYEEKKVEFVLTNLVSGTNVFSDEHDCNQYDIVRYRGEPQKASYTIVVRSREAAGTTLPLINTSCGHPTAVKPEFSIPPGWNMYRCMNQTEAEIRGLNFTQCLLRGNYSTLNSSNTAGVRYGCPGADTRCCPPAG